MNSITRSVGAVLLALAAACAAAQTINPATDVRWPTCTTGQFYEPFNNACASGASGGSGGSLNGPVDAQTGTAYTVALADAPNGLGTVTMSNAATNTVTIPPNSSVAFPVGTVLEFTQLGAGQTTLAAGAGVTIDTPTSLSARAQYSTIAVKQIATNVWVAEGDLQ